MAKRTSTTTEKDDELISLDYAIKYLLRNKSDYAILEGFISTILKAIGYKPIKIDHILDPETDKEKKEEKRYITDLLVKDEEGRSYLIEIDKCLHPYLIEKSLLSTEKEIIRKIKAGNRALDAIKVFHISLLYFKISQNALEGPIYHGKVFVKNFLSKQQEASSYHQITDERHILHELDELHPEYIYVSIDQFDNETHGEELNEWLYLLKNSAIKKDFKSKSVLQASHRLNRLKMSEEALNAYDKHKYEELKRIGSIAVRSCL